MRSIKSGTAPGSWRRARTLTWMTRATTIRAAERRTLLRRIWISSYCSPSALLALALPLGFGGGLAFGVLALGLALALALALALRAGVGVRVGARVRGLIVVRVRAGVGAALGVGAGGRAGRDGDRGRRGGLRLGGQHLVAGVGARGLDDDADDVELGEADERADVDRAGQVAAGGVDLDDLTDRDARHERLVGLGSEGHQAVARVDLGLAVEQLHRQRPVAVAGGEAQFVAASPCGCRR